MLKHRFKNKEVQKKRVQLMAMHEVSAIRENSLKLQKRISEKRKTRKGPEGGHLPRTVTGYHADKVQKKISGN
jgi:hypothetical protein